MCLSQVGQCAQITDNSAIFTEIDCQFLFLAVFSHLCGRQWTQGRGSMPGLSYLGAGSSLTIMGSGSTIPGRTEWVSSEVSCPQRAARRGLLLPCPVTGRLRPGHSSLLCQHGAVQVGWQSCPPTPGPGPVWHTRPATPSHLTLSTWRARTPGLASTLRDLCAESGLVASRA